MEHFKAIILKCGRGCLREVSFMRGSNCSNFTVKGVLDKWTPMGDVSFMQEVVNVGSSTVVSSKSHICS